MAVYHVLHNLILSGKLTPGTILSQVEVARSLNVSRTPVREAMRMLKESGLLVGEANQRSRVLGFDPHDIEALYMKRIVLETLAVTITTHNPPPELLAELDDVISALESDAGHSDFALWLALHRRFHRLIVSRVSDTLSTELATLELRSERYQSAYKGQHLPGWWQRGEAEHRAIYHAIKQRDGGAAAALIAKHLSRTALELIAALTPEFDTTAIRFSLRFATAGGIMTRDGATQSR